MGIFDWFQRKKERSVISEKTYITNRVYKGKDGFMVVEPIKLNRKEYIERWLNLLKSYHNYQGFMPKRS